MNTTTADGAGAPGTVSVLVEAARATWVAENRAAGQRLETCYALFRACRADEHCGADPEHLPGYAVLDPFEVCATHVVAQFAISTGRAGRMVTLSVDLAERYPDVLTALVDGRIELRVAELLARQMRTVDEAAVEQVQREAISRLLAALENGTQLGDKAIRDMIDAIIRDLDPDGLRRRRQDARLGRGVSISAGSDGMAHLWGCLASDEMAMVSAQLDRRVAAYATVADTAGASPTEQRADALVALICGEPVDSPLTPGAPGAVPATGVPVRPKVTVITGRDNADGPVVEFPRTGQSSVRALLAMLATGDGASLERLDPTIGAYDDPGRLHTYRPSAALARTIRLRDGTCRHPGCTVAAEHCDVDHVIPFDHDDPTCGGATCECNHCIFCRSHHRFKTFSDWTYSMTPDGTLTITTPDGTVMHTEPTGPLAEHRRETATEGHTRWRRQQRRAQATTGHDNTGTRPPAEPTARHRRAQRTRAERRLVEQAHSAARAEADQRATDARKQTDNAPSSPATTPTPRAHADDTLSVIEEQLDDFLHPIPY